MIKNIKYTLLQILLLSMTFIGIETVYLLHQPSMPPLISILRIALFDCSAAALLVAIIQIKLNQFTKILLVAVTLFCAVYATAQLGFISFLGNYISFKNAGQAGKVTEYIIDFIKFLKPTAYCTLIFPLLYALYQFKDKTQTALSWKNLVLTLLISLLSYAGAISTVKSSEQLYKIYKNPTFIETALREFGTQRFMIRDVITMMIPPEEDAPVIEVITPEETPEPVEPEIEQIDYSRFIDDTLWIEAKDNEEKENIRQLDEYLMSKNITDKNEMTGLFEGKNLIYIMIEAFDYIAIDKTLTPTLYMMQQQGWDFNNYYTPKYSCTTGESEFIALTSLVPSSSVCTPNSYSKNKFSNSILTLFQNAGYHVSAYHNWEDEFYDRRELYENMGVSEYYNIDQMNFKIIHGWQSDDELMKEAIPHFINQEKFMAHIVTSGMHFPYDSDSTLGNRYMKEINAVYPEYDTAIKRYISKSMELDKAMQTLLTELQNAGKLENTVIVMFADHHPLKTAISTLVEYTDEFDRSYGLNEDKTPLIIYNAATESKDIDTVSSTFDLIPTVANLFNLNYDPRLYVGTDIFSTDENTVIFTNGDWISTYGWYKASESTFYNFDDSNPASEKWIENQNKKVSNAFSTSLLIYKTDYFKKRDWITNPATENHDSDELRN